MKIRGCSSLTFMAQTMKVFQVCWEGCTGLINVTSWMLSSELWERSGWLANVQVGKDTNLLSGCLCLLLTPRDDKNG